MSTYESLLYNLTNGIVTISLNRPERYNALNEQMKRELLDAFKGVEKDPAVRCIVLRGSGDKAFCSGQDLKERTGKLPSLKESLEKSYNPLILRMRSIEKPIIAMINGVAAGAGCSIALACDLRVMSTTATLIEVFVRIGLVPDSGSHWFLPRLVGMARAFEYAATGREISAEEAERVGLVNKVASPDLLEDTVGAIASSLAAGPTRAIGLIKRTLNRAMTSDLENLLQYEAFVQQAASQTRDYTEGVAAFLEKRPVRFTGN